MNEIQYPPTVQAPVPDVLCSGKYDFRRIIRLVEKYLSDIPDVRVENRRTPPPLYVPEHLTVPRDTHQAHVMIGSRGYNAYDDKRTALYL